VRSTETECDRRVAHMDSAAENYTPQTSTSGPSRLADFHTQRKASRALASAFQCPLITQCPMTAHVNKAEPRKLQAGDLLLLGVPPGFEHLVDTPNAVCTKCVNRVKHLRQKAIQGTVQENIEPDQPDLNAEIAELRHKLQKAEARAQKATKEGKALKRKMSGASKNGELTLLMHREL
jgi:hypothetical protein